MRVTDWQKWTSFKKKVAVSSVLLSIILGLCIENGSMWYGVVGLMFGALSAYTVNTIEEHEWLPQESLSEQETY